MIADALPRRAALGLLLGAGLAAAAGAGHAAPLQAVRAKGVLRVAVYRDFRPWSWREGGQLVGIDADLGRALAETLGLRAELWDFMADEEVGDDLRNTVWRGPLTGGQVADVMLHAPYDLAFGRRHDRVALVAPYCRESFLLACRPGGQAECDALPTELAGKPIAVELDSLPDFYLSSQFGGVLRASVMRLPSGDQAARAVQEGRAEAVLATRAQIEHAAATPGAPRLALRTRPLPAMPSQGWDVGMAVRDDSRDLGDALEDAVARLAASGQLDAIFARYGVRRVPPVQA